MLSSYQVVAHMNNKMSLKVLIEGMFDVCVFDQRRRLGFVLVLVIYLLCFETYV